MQSMSGWMRNEREANDDVVALNELLAHDALVATNELLAHDALIATNELLAHEDVKSVKANCLRVGPSVIVP